VRKNLFIKFTAVLLTLLVNIQIVSLALANNGPIIIGPVFDPQVPKEISITIAPAQYAKFQKNILELYVSEQSTIDSEYKRKVSATFSWVNPLGKTIVEKGTIRVQGDMKDHVAVTNGMPYTSLQANLKTGNIGGITKFKILIPITRGGATEIFTTVFFEKIGFVAPFTQLINLSFNGERYPMLFQEKVSKELLERFRLREAPIIEGDERQWWKDIYIYNSKHLQNYNQHLPPHRCCYSSLDNKKLAGNDNFLRIIQNGLTIFTAALKKYNPYLHSIEIRHTEETFPELMLGLNAKHGLPPTNSKFYYDPMYNVLVPIYYDGTSGILDDHIVRHVVRPHLIDDKVLEVLKMDNFYNEVINDYIARGGDSVSLVTAFLDEFRASINSYDPDIAPTEASPPDLNSPSNYQHYVPDDGYDTKPSVANKEIRKKIFDQSSIDAPFVFTTREAKRKTYSLCYLNTIGKHGKITVEDFIFTGKNKIECKKVGKKFYKKSLKGNVTFNYNGHPMYVQTIGNTKVGENEIHLEQLFISKLDVIPASEITPGKELVVPPKKTLWIEFTEPADKLIQELDIKLSLDMRDRGTDVVSSKVILSGDLTNLRKIRVTSINDVNSLIASIPDAQSRFDERLLTGCITILDAKINQLEIIGSSLICEDAINIVRSNGQKIEIDVSNAKYDALDVDFSTIRFSRLHVINAGNDCVDFSAGNYVIEKATLTRCSDKGISVGERSTTKIINTSINDADIGIASKDSSSVSVLKSIMRNVGTCIAAYNKKQEYGGATIKVAGKLSGCKKQFFSDEFSTVELSN